MSDTVIRVENLGKKYIIGHQKQERYTALRDVITNKVKSIGSLLNPQAKNENPAFEEFWALKDVSFDIKPGDRVGIIGRNGAGKSTLLKILSRITEPTKGSIKIKGRVASLLEVGTGFHPELTGRENIFLNGAILGMGKEEIKRKFDEIVAFAEVEKFLDTPVKRYSSGMYVRLAFAVAAHLEPEILIVDEVLAVGDAQFQEKCLYKMEDVSQEGRTVLFVSHNLSSISRLCNSGVLLNSGKIVDSGTIKDILTAYKDISRSPITCRNKQASFVVKSKNFQLEDIKVSSNIISVLEELQIDALFSTDSLDMASEYSVFFCFTDSSKSYYSSIFSKDESIFFRFNETSKLNVSCKLNFHTFLPGKFYIEAGLFNKFGECQLWVETHYEIQVREEMFYGGNFDGRCGYSTTRGTWSNL
ncbi:ABC transporter ATP-binding protein [Dolichospermum planctonicum]|uniref:ABC transporter-like protein n=1 Tax=Dolichospermum planctonicum TaxID=136072 RepID=A0A480ADA2_9CYAN|nr:ABC transporter ATP-binding protein [Dolichospermum planctonicum]GCL42779.1 ABC transporter-like protein [Dolichospermum planctonicum]